MNQYQIPNFPEYKSMYVDHKLDKIAEIERSRYDMASAENDQLTRTMGAIRLLDRDKQVIKDAEDRVRTMIGSSGKFQLLGKNVSAAVTGFVTDRDMADAMDSKAVADKEDEYANQLRAKGIEVPLNMIVQKDPKTGLVLYNPDGTVMMKKASELHNTKTQGIYKPAVEERLDYQQEALTLLAGMAESGGVNIAMANMNGLSPTDIGTWVTTGGKGVSRDKKNAVAKAVTDEYIQTAAGNQLYRVKTLQEVDPMTGMLKTDAQARKEIQKSLEDWGEKQVGWVSNGAQQVTSSGAAESSGGPDDPYSLENTYVPEQTKTDALSWDEGFNIKDYALKYVKNMFGVNSTKKAVELEKEVERSGGFGNVNLNNYDKEDVANYIMSSKQLKKDFPKKQGQSDPEWIEEVKDSFRSVTKSYSKIAQDKKALASVLHSTLFKSKVYDEVGREYTSIDSFLDTANDWTFTQTDATIKEGLQKSLEATINSDNKIPHIKGELITGGNPDLVGKVKVTFTVDGKDYSLYTIPAAGSDVQFTTSKRIAQAQKAKKVGEIPLNASGSLVIKTDVAESQIPGKRVYRVYLAGKDASGKITDVFSPTQVAEEDFIRFQKSVGGQSNAMGQAWRHYNQTNEKQP
jgi:hypothetical protein